MIDSTRSAKFRLGVIALCIATAAGFLLVPRVAAQNSPLEVEWTPAAYEALEGAAQKLVIERLGAKCERVDTCEVPHVFINGQSISNGYLVVVATQVSRLFPGYSAQPDAFVKQMTSDSPLLRESLALAAFKSLVAIEAPHEISGTELAAVSASLAEVAKNDGGVKFETQERPGGPRVTASSKVAAEQLRAKFLADAFYARLTSGDLLAAQGQVKRFVLRAAVDNELQFSGVSLSAEDVADSASRSVELLRKLNSEANAVAGN